MKNNLVWAKTLLSVYRYLDRIAGAIDKIIIQKALGCGNVSSMSFYFNSAEIVSQKLIDLSERKVTLINVKVLVEDTLSQMSEGDASLLIDKFFEGMKNQDLALRHGTSQRTLFRRLDSSLSTFSHKLASKGWTDEKLSSMLKNEAWILNVKQRIEEKEADISLSNVFLQKAASLS